MNSDFWLYRWLDEYEVVEPADLIGALKLARPYERLIELAEEEKASGRNRAPLSDEPTGEATVIAGRRVDLSGIQSCNNVECMTGVADQLCSTIGHYFDRVVVDSFGVGRFLHAVEHSTHDLLMNDLRNHLSVLLRLREVGAEPFLEFREKPYAFCADHFRQHAEQVGLPATLDDALAQELMQQIAETAEVEKTGTVVVDGELVDVYFYNSRQTDLGRSYFIPSGDAPPTPEEFASSWYEDYAVSAVGDAALAKHLGAPLASAADNPWKLHKPLGEIEDEVALSLNLPVLSDLPAREVIAMREDHKEEFEKFRAALRAAIRERLEDHGETDPTVTATRVMRDYIRPALADIEVQMKASKRSVATKLGVTTAVGVTSASVGLLVAMPLVLGSVAATSAGIVHHATKFIDERRDVELSDMYFLWRLTHAHG